MSQQSRLKSSSSAQQIVIQEAPSSEYSHFEGPIDQILFQDHEHQQSRWVEELKINRQKLLKYSNGSQNNHNLQPLSSKHHPNPHPEQKVLTPSTQLNHTPSLKTLRNIKHKITHPSTRLKTSEDKENDYKAILPKMNIRNTKISNVLNKTTSVLSLKENSCIGNTGNIKNGAESNRFCSSKVGVKSTRVFDKHKTAKIRLDQVHSKDTLSRSVNKSSSLSKFRYYAANQASNDLSIDHSQIIAAFTQITEKQQFLSQQKTELEEKIKELRDNIQKEHHLIEEMARNKQKMNSTMTRQEHLSRYSLDGAKIYKKKLENCQLDAKTMEDKLSQVTQQNTKLSQAINQEKDLIGMYESVIEELKGQLKLQKQTKAELQKKVAILKKTLKSTQSKANSQQSNTRQLFHKIFVSLDRWQ